MRRTQLNRVLRLAQPALADRDYIPSFICFCFDGSTVKAYNDIIGIEISCDVDIDGAVNGNLLLGLLSSANGKEVKFEIQNDDLKVTSGTTKSLLHIIPQEEFLFDFPENDSTQSEFHADQDFMEGIKRCLISTTDDEYSVLGGITIKIENDKGVLYSSDHKTITKYELEQEIEGDLVAIIPSIFCKTLQRMVKITGLVPVINIGEDCAIAIFDEDTKLLTKLINDKRLKFDESIKKSLKQFEDYVPIPKTISNGIKQSTMILEGTKQELCELSVVNKKLSVHARSSKGEVRRSIKVDKKHDDVTVFVPPDLIERVLKYVDYFYILERACVFGDDDRYSYIVANKYTK